MAALEPPSLASRSRYARKFQDPWFWQPYVDEVLSRHNLPSGLATLGTGGTFPTFLVGAYVIKFFGQRFEGAECFEIERSVHTRVLPRLQVTIPRHVRARQALGIPVELIGAERNKQIGPLPPSLRFIDTRRELTRYSSLTVSKVARKPTLSMGYGKA